MFYTAPFRRGLAASGVCLGLLLPGWAAAQDLYAPRSDWASLSRGEINISGFVYRDVNRNGIYDLPDRPMEDIAYGVISSNGQAKRVWTNSNGFANFSMSIENEDAMISHPGDYTFEVIVPKGWHLTTDNRRQVKSFRFLPGSVADIVADPPFVAVGMAQDLSISGRIGKYSPGMSVEARGPGGEVLAAEISEDGRFELPASVGTWTLRARDGNGGETIEREVTLDQAPAQLSTLVFGQDRIDPIAAEARSLDFEDVTAKDIREMPNGVGGLNWWNMVCLQVDISYTNNAVSGNYVAYNSSGHPGRIYSEQPFDFVGGYFGVAWPRANGEWLNIRGWRGEELVYEDRLQLSNLGPVWFAADYLGISRLDLATEHYWQFVTDDLSMRLAGD